MKQPTAVVFDWDAAITLGAIGAALSTPRLARVARRRFGAQLGDLLVLGGIGAAAYGGAAWLERHVPFRRSWQGPDGDDPTNLALLFVVSPVEGLIVDQLTSRASRTIQSTLRLPSGSWSTATPLPVRLAVAVLVSEFAHYWHHRWAHKNRALWRYHRFHHQIERLSWRNATRFHPLDVIPLVIMQDLPLLVAGMDRETHLALRSLKTVHGLLQHTNVMSGDHALGAMFSTGAQHRRHHSNELQCRESNYGAVLTLWDRMFGTSDRFTASNLHATVGPGPTPRR